MVIFSYYLIDCNINLRAKSLDNETNNIIISRSNKLPRDGNFDWSPIEVISKPLEGGDLRYWEAGGPKIATEGEKIYVVWEDNASLNGVGGGFWWDYEIFYRYFDGEKWSEIQAISEPVPGKNYNTAPSYHPDLVVEDGKIYVVWEDTNKTNGAGGDHDIFFRCNITGSSWEDIQVLSEPVVGQNNNIYSSIWPTIAVENGNIYVVWSDPDNTSGAGYTEVDIFYRCNLTGTNWEEVQAISEPILGQNNNNGNSFAPEIAVENGKIYTVWWDNYDILGTGSIDDDIFYRCNLTGNSWEDIQILSEPDLGNDNDVGSSIWPEIAVENGKIFTIWQDQYYLNGAGLDYDIYYRSNLTGTSWEDIQLLSEPVIGENRNTGWSNNSAIAVENGKIYVVWQDENNTNGSGMDYDIFYRCNLTGASWEPVQVISELFNNMNYNNGHSYFPDIEVNFSKVHVFWYDATDISGVGTNLDLFYRKYPSIPIALFYPKVIPISGNTGTIYNFTVTYIHTENKSPLEIKVKINGLNYSMLEADYADTTFWDGKNYFYKTKMVIGTDHTFEFWASDLNYTICTACYNNPNVYNTPPKIITEDNLTSFEDNYYELNYKYEDIDRENIGQVGTWNFSTNASWLSFNPTTAILYGTPTNDNIAKFWVNISINDTIDMVFTNFTLAVINVNDDPLINTTNIEVTYEDELYEVDYNATDIDSPLEAQIWFLETNASLWLNINQNTGVISGTPTNDDIGSYWVNISVEDGDMGLAFTNFSLIVLNVNDPPVITTEDVLEASVNALYKVDYNATDIDPTNDTLTWSLDTNASWLGIDSTTGVLSGIPTVDDVGFYGVNVSVDDGNNGQDWHEFVLTLNQEGFENQPPNITTEDEVNAVVGEEYSVDYEAEDDRTPINNLQWSLETNTSSWLRIDPNTGVLNGTPQLKDVGSYWVKVSVFDGEDGWDYSDFTLYVTTEPITTQPPELSNPLMTPTSGDTETLFTFSVDYNQLDGDPPDSIQVVIDGEWYDMTSTNGHYEYSTKLSEGNHTYYFTTRLGEFRVDTEDLVTPYIEKPEGQPEDKDGDEDNTMLFALIGIIVVIIVALILLFIFLKKKKGKEEELPVEEVEPPPTEEIPPEAPPPEQPPTPEVPPEQVSEEAPSEVPTEQIPEPETPPSEEPLTPEVSPEQPPIPEVTPPQVESAPEPAPMPLVEEQPEPQVEPQPQVEAQGTQGQALVPTIKAEPTIEEKDA